MFKRPIQQQLLSCYCSNKKPVKNHKLNLFGKALTVVDTIQNPEGLQNIRELDISHNAIHHIENIKQFKNLEFINITHNRIENIREILKFNELSKLHTVFVKDNPFLKDNKLMPEALKFVLSLNTDVQFINNIIQSKIEDIVTKKIHTKCFENYLRKVDLHIELLSNYQFEQNFISSEVSIFPKIKKLFQQNIYDELHLKRQFISRIDNKYFEREQILSDYLVKQMDIADNIRSSIIKNIYEKEESLRNLRASHNQRILPKKVVQRNYANFNFDAPGRISPRKGYLKQSTKQPIVRNNQRFNISKDHCQNQPKRLSLQYADIKENENFEQTFMNLLLKMNPLYHLLHSPLHSLKSHEKQLLIQNLLLHLKQKMKEIYRLEKNECLHQKVRVQFEQFQQHMKNMGGQFNQQLQQSQEKLKKMSKLYHGQFEKAENLKVELEVHSQEIANLKHQNTTLMEFKQSISDKSQLQQRNELIEQQISEKYFKILKKQYLRKLQYKATQFKRFKIIRKQNQITEQHEIKKYYFDQLKYDFILTKNTKYFRYYQLKLCSKQFLQYLNRDKQLKDQQKWLQSKLKIKYFNGFLKQLTIKYQNCLQSNKMIQTFQRKRARKIKVKIFILLNSLTQEKYQQNYEKQINDMRQKLLIRKYFRFWIRFVTQHYFKQSSIEASHILQAKKIAIKHILQAMYQRLNYNAKCIAVDSLLLKIRKIKSYFNFSKCIQKTLTIRNNKVNKIIRIQQHKYIFIFIKFIRDKLLQKKILVSQQMERRRMDQLKSTEEKAILIQNKNKRIMKLQALIKKINKKMQIKIIVRQNNGMILLKQKQNNQLKLFFTNFRNKFVKELKYSIKMFALSKSSLFINRIRTFYQNLAKNKQKLKGYLESVAEKRVIKSFYRWKAFLLWTKLEHYRQRYFQLEPQIMKVTQIQRQTSSQKILLIQQISNKQAVIQQYIKKCEQYEYLLHSKELKYERLKEIYSDTINKQELNHTIKIKQDSNEKQTPESIYLKYLPSQLKQNDKTYTFREKQQEIQRKYLQNGTNYKYSDNLKPSVKNREDNSYLYNQTNKKEPAQLRIKDKFISSFKQF